MQVCTRRCGELRLVGKSRLRTESPARTKSVLHIHDHGIRVLQLPLLQRHQGKGGGRELIEHEIRGVPESVESET